MAEQHEERALYYSKPKIELVYEMLSYVMTKQRLICFWPFQS